MDKGDKVLVRLATKSPDSADAAWALCEIEDVQTMFGRELVTVAPVKGEGSVRLDAASVRPVK